MSLVEKALKKLHESRLAAANGRPAIGAPTGTGVAAALFVRLMTGPNAIAKIKMLKITVPRILQ